MPRLHQIHVDGYKFYSRIQEWIQLVSGLHRVCIRCKRGIRDKKKRPVILYYKVADQTELLSLRPKIRLKNRSKARFPLLEGPSTRIVETGLKTEHLLSLEKIMRSIF